MIERMITIENDRSGTKRRGESHFGKKILIVDDEKDIREVIKETLKVDNFTVLEAETGEYAWTWVRHQNPDLVLLDVILPGKWNGFDVYKKMKADKSTEKTPVVFLTAVAKEEKPDIKIDDRNYFYKPFSPIQLVDKIYEVLDKSEEPEVH